MTNRDYSFFNIAKEISFMSPYPRHHIGCVITYKNRIISSGYNSNKTSPLQKKYNAIRFTADTPAKNHAETKALIPLLKMKDIDLSKVKVYCYREHADGTIAVSRPCASCMRMLKDNNIHNIYYTTEDGYANEQI